MRVSDAERNEVAEVLSTHYADGRLDATEFKERLDRAMAAKTRADLSGLLTDLPRLEVQAPPPPPRPMRARVMTYVLVAVLAAAAWSVVAAPHVPWVLIVLVAWFLYRRDRRWSGRPRRHPADHTNW
jgi:hypothetical protein